MSTHEPRIEDTARPIFCSDCGEFVCKTYDDDLEQLLTTKHLSECKSDLKKNQRVRYANNMQNFFTELLKKNGFAIFINIVGLIGLMANLYLASRLYPLADTDRRLEFQIDTATAQIQANKELVDQQFVYVTSQLNDVKEMLREIRVTINK